MTNQNQEEFKVIPAEQSFSKPSDEVLKTVNWDRRNVPDWLINEERFELA
jgi:hypothetical protein